MKKNRHRGFIKTFGIGDQYIGSLWAKQGPGFQQEVLLLGKLQNREVC